MFTIPDIHSALEPIVCWSGAFTEEEIEEIIVIGDTHEFQKAKVGVDSSGSVKDDVRKSKIAWIYPSEDTRWLFNKMAEIVARINTDKFQFSLSHINAFQYTTYVPGDYYKWHIDASSTDTFGPEHRKLGLTLLLSDPETEFTGGEFQINPSGNPNEVNSTKLKKGDIVAFPSFVPHQVSEVTSGKRKSLVCWVHGPKFK
jgi:PKHD-type hydroxylase